jgi:uncharacterized protein YrrD
MDLYFGVTVEQRDGDTLGHLQRVVCDVDTREVRALVVQGSRWDEGAVLLPVEAIDSSDDDAVMVALSEEQYVQLSTFEDVENVAPPPSADNAADLEEEPIDLPDVPPVGAATGIETIAFTPVIEEIPRIRATEEVLGPGTVIYATDGDLGHLRAVTIDDETRRLTSLLGERGAVFPHDFEISMEWVKSIRPDAVILSVNKSEVQAAANG